MGAFKKISMQKISAIGARQKELGLGDGGNTPASARASSHSRLGPASRARVKVAFNEQDS